MKRVLAFVDGSPCSAGVLSVADGIAGLWAASVHAVTVPETETDDSDRGSREGSVADRLVAELRAPDVVAGVMGARSVPGKPGVMGHVTEAVAVAAPVLLVIVPPDVAAPWPRGGRQVSILMPLDGEPRTSAAVMEVVDRLPPDDTDVTVLHVFDSDSLPPLASAPEDRRIVAEEFGLVHCGGVIDRIELRLGPPAGVILRVASELRSDLVLVAWGQDLGPGRAEVVRRLLEDEFPVGLVPIEQPRSSA